MTDEWGEPVVAERKPAHNFDADPIVIGTFQRTDQVNTTDRDTGEPRRSNMHRLIGDDGEAIDCWGTSMLDDLLRGISAGQRIRIQYLGMEGIEGGRTIKRFEVRVGQGGSRRVTPDEPADTDDDIPF